MYPNIYPRSISRYIDIGPNFCYPKNRVVVPRVLRGQPLPAAVEKDRGRARSYEGICPMQPTRVILANEPRLLREMLKRVITRAPELQVVGEVTDPTELSPLLRQTHAQWIIVSLWPEGLVPSAIESLLVEHSSVRVLGMAGDGSQARIKRAEFTEQELCNLSLSRLIAVLSEGYI